METQTFSSMMFDDFSSYKPLFIVDVLLPPSMSGWYMNISIPKCSMYGIFTYIYPKNCTNVGKYTIHRAYGIVNGCERMSTDVHVTGGTQVVGC